MQLAFWSGECKKWNFNAHPLEIAREIESRAKDPDEVDIALEAVEKYFNAGTAENIRDLIAYL